MSVGRAGRGAVPRACRWEGEALPSQGGSGCMSRCRLRARGQRLSVRCGQLRCLVNNSNWSRAGALTCPARVVRSLCLADVAAGQVHRVPPAFSRLVGGAVVTRKATCHRTLQEQSRAQSQPTVSVTETPERKIVSAVRRGGCRQGAHTPTSPTFPPRLGGTRLTHFAAPCTEPKPPPG